MEVGDAAKRTIELLKEKKDAEPFNLTEVLEPFQSIKELSDSEKVVLGQMIDNEDPELLKALKTLTPSELTSSVMSLIRTRIEKDSGLTEESSDAAFEKALQTMRTNKETLVKSSFNALKKMLQTLKNKPDQLKSRRHRMDNIIVKKYVTETAGALDFMKAVGFTETESKKGVKYLEIEQATVDTTRIDHAVELLSTSAKQNLEAITTQKNPAEKKLCVGGCGFWGDEKQDFYCSVCYKTKKSGRSPVAESKPEKCPNNCGFYGAKKFGGLCSLCFDKKKAIPVVSAWRRKFKKAVLKIKAVRAFRSAPRLLQTNKKRCWQCKRKVGLLGIECKCGFVFCGNHRYAEEHECRFDHKGFHKKKLRKENEQIRAKKFETLD